MASVSPPASPPVVAGPALPLAARRHPFVARVAIRLRRRCDVRGGATVAVGLSGGADSVALLAALAVIRGRGRARCRVTPVAVHVHHHLRGATADADAAFARALAARLDVPFARRDIDPGRAPGNTAAAARGQRYDALLDAAREAGAAHVAVGHHADDQLETMLIALCRGAGLAGLRGMPWSRPLDGYVTLVRPLLDRRRAECEAFCAAAGTGWRDDPGNTDPANLRARVRRDLLPAIEAVWPGAASRATGTADAIAAAQCAVEDELARVFGAADTRSWERAILATLPAPLVAAGLRRAAVHADPGIADVLGQRHLRQAAEAIADETRRPRTYVWPREARLCVTAGEVRLHTPTAESPRRRPS